MKCLKLVNDFEVSLSYSHALYGFSSEAVSTMPMLGTEKVAQLIITLYYLQNSYPNHSGSTVIVAPRIMVVEGMI
jgi:hypothetical protein